MCHCTKLPWYKKCNVFLCERTITTFLCTSKHSHELANTLRMLAKRVGEFDSRKELLRAEIKSRSYD